MEPRNREAIRVTVRSEKTLRILDRSEENLSRSKDEEYSY